MSHTSDVAQGNKERAVKEERMGKAFALVPPSESPESLWVLGVLVTYKIPSPRTGGAYALSEVAT
jgi:hypothetical protein